MKELGTVKLVQIQPSGLIIDTPSGDFYDPTRRVEVDQLLITPKGIEADLPSGQHVLDIHHINHPGKAYDHNDLISIGFTSHYQAMRKRFGEHMVDGIAGENIIIQVDREIWEPDLGRQIGIQNGESGQKVFLNLVKFAAPCEEFSHFAANSQHERLPPGELKSVLQFLNNGRRGFLLVMTKDQENATVRVGDKVFVIQ